MFALTHQPAVTSQICCVIPSFIYNHEKRSLGKQKELPFYTFSLQINVKSACETRSSHDIICCKYFAMQQQIKTTPTNIQPNFIRSLWLSLTSQTHSLTFAKLLSNTHYFSLWSCTAIWNSLPSTTYKCNNLCVPPKDAILPTPIRNGPSLPLSDQLTTVFNCGTAYLCSNLLTNYINTFLFNSPVKAWPWNEKDDETHFYNWAFCMWQPSVHTPQASRWYAWTDSHYQQTPARTTNNMSHHNMLHKTNVTRLSGV